MSRTDTESGSATTVTTQVPARLDRLPWSAWHTRILIGLGAVWILDGLEVTVVGNVAGRLSEEGSGLDITAAQVTGPAAALYVAGACVGALVFAWLTDRYGRKRLFMVTLAVYLAGTAMTALATEAWMFFFFRFVTGLGIGGEYAAINSAIDELMPARYRGRVDLGVNGTFWLGAAGGALLSVVMLNTAIFPIDVGWRLTFALGVVLGFVILLVRRHVPESPRWLCMHGRADEAAALVDDAEKQIVEHHTGKRLELPEPKGELTIDASKSRSLAAIGRTLVRDYPKRSVLGLALFIGQAFLYNAITFGYGSILETFYDVPSDRTGYYFAVIAVGNLMGPLLLGPLFDSVGRRVMITSTYVGSGLALFVTAWLFGQGHLNATTLTACWCVVLFIASTGASSAYLTVSEIFPMEARASAIALFYAVGTAAGGIAGPLVFSDLTEKGDVSDTVLAFCIGASLMTIAGIIAGFLAVRAERRSLEDIAPPLQSVSPGTSSGGDNPGTPSGDVSPGTSPGDAATPR
ncbi:MFS transporter [Streptodolium elevatio]